jgi:membrane-associated protein
MAEFFASAGPWAYLGLFALSTGESSAFLGFAVPGETFALLAGAVSARGHLSLGWVIVAVIVGGVIGDSVGYAVGRHFGGCGKHGWLGRVWSCARMAKVKRFLDARGRASIFFARFIGFLRPLAPFAAGAVGMAYRPFLFFNVAGAIAWGAATVLAGFFIGEAADDVFRTVGVWGGVALAVAAAGIFLVLRARRRVAARPPGAEGPPARTSS